MTVTQPSQDPNKDSATSAWEEQVTETTNRIQYQIDNITESVDTTSPTVAIYSHTSDGAIQSFEPAPSGDGYVSYYTYSGDYPTLPVGGLVFSAYSDDEINFKIRQYRETANRPTNPGTVEYTVSTGAWLSSNNWTKVKLARGATNVWYCDTDIVGTTGAITAKWGNPRLLYGGQTGSGILYYNTAEIDGSAPGKPLANGYDFEAGVFNGLRNAGQDTGGTNNWVYSPITVEVSGANSINKKHWQSAYTVEVSELTEHTTTLSSPITSTTSTANIAVASTADFPIPSTDNTPLTIYIGSEQITYTGLTNTTFLGIQRAQNSTSGALHPNNPDGSGATVTTMIPVQVITFGTPAGFVPIGANLQSDNFQTDSAGWQIQRSDGSAEFSNVKVRGGTVTASLVTGVLEAATIAAEKINTGTISAVTLDSSTITAGNVTVTGGFSANQLSVGVIVDTINGTAGRGIAANSSSVITTFTSNNSTGTGAFDTDALIVGTAVATSTGNSGQGADDATGSAVSLYLYQNGSPVSGSNAATATASGGGTPYGVGAGVVKVQLAKNTVYEVRIAWNNNSMGYSGGGSVTYGLFEVRRT